MKIVILSLCLTVLLSGCTTTDIVTEYREVVVKPPASDFTLCLQPFTLPPVTYGEAVERDPLWFASWKECANKIQRLRAFYGFLNVAPNTGE
jgi:hypothetical protein